ncbi:MAG: hypothetical protein M1840_007870 [Geoglossum simile]|nr:MAG: hypothetical protein M1840_007870 [Geoglossum simile]
MDDAGCDWEDANEEMDERMDAIHRIDEMAEGFVQMNVDEYQYEKLRQNSDIRQLSHIAQTKFNIIKRLWMSSVRSYLRKITAAESGNSSIRLSSFKPVEIVVWQISTMSGGNFKCGWYQLPGPASLWPDNFDFDSAGWVVPTMERKYTVLCRKMISLFHGRGVLTMKDVNLVWLYFFRFAK